MIHRFITIGFLIILISSCKKETIAKFEIENRTNFPIDSLSIVPNGYESNYYISLDSGEIKNYNCNMTEIVDSDGEYKLDFKINSDSSVSMTFGYYTNGFPLEELTRITIDKDTILFNPDFKDFGCY